MEWIFQLVKPFALATFYNCSSSAMLLQMGSFGSFGTMFKLEVCVYQGRCIRSAGVQSLCLGGPVINMCNMYRVLTL
jgi:hypothetical protein